MTRRFIQDPNTLELLEVDANYIPLARNGDAALWNDRVYQDGGDPRFRSRTQHRQFMQREGLTTIDDYANEFKKRTAERRRFLETGYDPTRRPVIERAIHDLANGRKRP